MEYERRMNPRYFCMKAERIEHLKIEIKQLCGVDFKGKIWRVLFQI